MFLLITIEVLMILHFQIINHQYIQRCSTFRQFFIFVFISSLNNITIETNRNSGKLFQLILHINYKYYNSKRVMKIQNYSNYLRKAFHIYLVILVFFIARYILEPHHTHQNLRQINRKTAPLLKELVKTKYFKIIRINLQNNCPFWAQKKMCSSGSCNVCRCDQKDIPFSWTKTDKIKSTTKDMDHWSPQRDNLTLKWIWHVQDQQNDKGEYFDVDQNKQAFTNYNGSFIWELIYKQNCFSGIVDDMCRQQQVLYKIISGLHTSISTHLSLFYKDADKAIPQPFKQKIAPVYYFNKQQYAKRVINHPDRVQNLYFLYGILLKSLIRVKNHILQYQIASDNFTDDLKSKIYLKTFIQSLQQFSDDLKLDQFFNSEQPYVKSYQKYIHNISKIMDCVECEKCRLFGKMQTYGLGTAMKVIFGYQNLKRNELVAMMNTLNKISMSIQANLEYTKNKPPLNEFYLKLYLSVGLCLFGFLKIALYSYMNLGGKVKKQFKHVFVKTE